MDLGVLSPLAYMLVLWALTLSQVSYVAPAREFSILIAILLGRQLFAEGQSRQRLWAGGLMVLGLILIALSK